jgi:hypothetical protein
MVRTVLVVMGFLFLAAQTLQAGVPAQELIELGKRCEERVARLRGLEVVKPIRWEVTTKDQVRKYLKETISQQYGPGEMQAEGDALRALGLIPEKLDYENFMVRLLEEQVGGYYDPKKETFYLADWIAPALQETIISHELTHALQDQHFGIDEFIDRIEGNSDAMVARAALAEGEATLVMMVDAMRHSGMDVDIDKLDLDGTLGSLMMSLSAAQFPSFAEAPRALRESLMFPYLKGLNFVIHGKQRGGWKRIDKVYADLPRSSEQILHPEKYFENRDEPTGVDFMDIEKKVARGWKMIYQDVLGEFMTLQLLDTLDDREEEQRAAAGWDGDRVWVFKRGEDLAWVQLSVWDSERDAIEYAGALAKTVPSRVTGFRQQPVGKQPAMLWKNPGGRVVYIQRTGKQVLVLENLEQALIPILQKSVFDEH